MVALALLIPFSALATPSNSRTAYLRALARHKGAHKRTFTFAAGFAAVVVPQHGASSSPAPLVAILPTRGDLAVHVGLACTCCDYASAIPRFGKKLGGAFLGNLDLSIGEHEATPLGFVPKLNDWDGRCKADNVDEEQRAA